MQQIEIELRIGDAVQIGDRLYTVIDIDDAEVTFRIDSVEDPSDVATTPAARAAK